MFFNHYHPSDDEIIMAHSRLMLDRDCAPPHSPEALVWDISQYDFGPYQCIYTNTVVDAGCAYEQLIARAQALDDPQLQSVLLDYLHNPYEQDLSSTLAWVSLIGKETPYVRFRWQGADHETACKLVPVKIKIDEIVDYLCQSHLNARLIAGDDIQFLRRHVAGRATWFDNTVIHSVALPPDIYAKAMWVLNLYKSKIIEYRDLIFMFKKDVRIMLNTYAEIIKIQNFYLAIAHPH